MSLPLLDHDITAEAAERNRAKLQRLREGGIPPLPENMETHAASVFKPIMEKLKTKPLAALDAETRENHVKSLQANWNAPERHLRNEKLNRDTPWGFKLEELKIKLGSGLLLCFVGSRGPGKTQMGVELMRCQTEDRLKTARFTDAVDIFVSIRDTYEGNRRESVAIASWIKPDLLVIDEIQERGETAWEDRIVGSILNKRYNAVKDTILISNLTKDQARESLGASIVSRMRETGGFVNFDWPSFR